MKQRLLKIRAPPESFRPIMGAPFLAAISITFTIFEHEHEITIHQLLLHHEQKGKPIDHRYARTP